MINNSLLVVAVDNGNKNTKVLGIGDNNLTFSSGYSETEHEPITKDNLLIYNNKHYQVGAKRFSVMFDKTDDDRTFILTLAAIGHTLGTQGISEANIVLAAGLPISSYGTLRTKFKQYFMRENVSFSYLEKMYKINIVDCYVFPQGYAAALSKYSDYKDLNAIFVDLGGYTTDVFQVNRGLQLISESARTYNNGVITLFRNIQQELFKLNINVSEMQIEEILCNRKPILFDDRIVQTVNCFTEKYTDDLINNLCEIYDLKVNPCVFVGGGAMLLKHFIENNNRVSYIEFLDQYANCRGYEILARKAIEKKDV